VSLDEEQPLFQEIKRKLDIQSSTKNFPKKKMLDPQASEILSKMNRNVKNEIVNFAYEGLAKICESLLPHVREQKFLMTEMAAKISKVWNLASLDKTAESMLKMSKNLFFLASILPKHLKSFRVIRAIIVGSCSARELEENFTEIDHPNSPPKFAKDARANGRRDFFRMFLESDDPETRIKKIARIGDDVVQSAVEDIASVRNVGTLSFGERLVKIPNTKASVVLPSLTRKRPIKDMYKSYKRNCFYGHLTDRMVRRSQTEKVAIISKSVYYKVVGALTSNSERIVKCVDYVTDVLVNESVSRLQKIINDLVVPTKKKQITKRLELLRNFLKNQFDTCARRNDDNVPSHGIQYALCLDASYEDGRTAKTCNGCMFVEAMMRKILPEAVLESRTEANTESVDDALLYIEDALNKFHLYQGHRIRVVNQQDGNGGHLERLRLECILTKKDGRSGILVIDWRMKWEAKRSRESSKHHYGKRGISWEGNVMKYFTYEAPSEKNGWQERAALNQVSLDQILDNGNQQCGLTVLSFLEACMVAISLKFPQLDQPSIVISDNASAYHRLELLLGTPFLNSLSLAFIIGMFIHTETQDGKGSVDAQLAVSGRKVIEFLTTRDRNEFKVAATPSTVTGKY
jgi:hypothetical protein